MQLSDQHIADFQALYLRRFGTQISKDEARTKGIKLLRLMSLVYRPMTKAEFATVQERRRKISI